LRTEADWQLVAFDHALHRPKISERRMNGNFNCPKVKLLQAKTKITH